MDNLYAQIPLASKEEVLETLVSGRNVRIERIVSMGQASPPGFWYDQDEHEWVVVLRGQARLRIGEEELALAKGDHVLIPAHTKHRVEWTHPEQPTIWLAVFFHEL